MNANEVLSQLSEMVSQHVKKNSSSYSPLCSPSENCPGSLKAAEAKPASKEHGPNCQVVWSLCDLKITLYSDDLLIQE